jgi:hypothetical protein
LSARRRSWRHGHRRPSRLNLRALGDRDKLPQDRGSALEAILRLAPILEEHDFHVRAHARRRPFVLNKGEQPLGVGERIVAERQHRTLRPGIDFGNVGTPAQRLDADHGQQMLHLIR